MCPKCRDAPAFVPPTVNFDAATAFLAALHAEERLVAMDAVREAALLTMAERLDAYPGNAQLWGQYIGLEAAMRGVNDGDSDFAKLLEDLQSPLSD